MSEMNKQYNFMFVLVYLRDIQNKCNRIITDKN